MTNTSRTAAVIGVITLGAVIYFTASDGSNPLSLVADGNTLELSWDGRPDEFYAIGHRATLTGPWTEIWNGSVNDGATIGTAVHPNMSNIVLTAFPSNSDAGSKWGLIMTWPVPPMTNKTMRIYVATTNAEQGYFHLWTSKVSPPVPARLTINKP